MDGHPNVGYVFCPGFGVRDGIETRVLGRYSARWDRDRIIPGATLLRKLLRSNFVLTPSGLVRRECYSGSACFRGDMPWVGDWYLWCLFALHYDVGYLAENMVCSREQHAMSMTQKLTRESQDRLDACAAEEISIPWLIRSKAHEIGNRRIERMSLGSRTYICSNDFLETDYRGSSRFMNFPLFEESLRDHASSEAERDFVRARVYDNIGNECYWRRELVLAKKFYRAALRRNPWMGAVLIKSLLLSVGRPGDYIRRTILSFR